MKLNEVTTSRSQTILTEGWSELTESQHRYLGRFERELWPLMEELKTVFEADLTAKQITDIFTGAEASAVASGNNRTALGKAVAEKFDTTVYSALDSAGDSSFDSVPLTVDDLMDGAAVIRGNGEMGPLYAVFSTTEGYNLMKNIGTAAYAGGEFQSQALRSGSLGTIAGVQCFMSHHITTGTTAGYMFGADSMRIAMQKNVDIEVARRAAAVGNDVVASLHAKAALLDANRAIRFVNV